jgi:hypothetical protein
MKKIIAAGNRYLKKMDLTDVALLKICLTALGVLIGLGSSKRHKKSMSLLAGFAFMGAWIPLMAKFFRAILTQEE